MHFSNAVIQIFCKAPVAGQVKTRLMPQLTAEQASDVHQRLALRTLKLVSSSNLCPVQLWCSPDIQHPFFLKAAEDYGFSLQTQIGGDLGERMDLALRTGLKDCPCAVLIGCDCPSLTAADLREAILALQQGSDVVLAPTEDGGYSLIGLVAPQPELFEAISWSTAAVMAQTRLKMAGLNLKSAELSIQWDVDNHADFLRFLAFDT